MVEAGRKDVLEIEKARGLLKKLVGTTTLEKEHELGKIKSESGFSRQALKAELRKMEENPEDSAIDWDDVKPHINPALDVYDGKAYVTITVPISNGTRENLVICSDGTSYHLNGDNSLLEFKPTSIPALMQNRWSLKSIHGFLEGKGERVSIAEAYAIVKEQYLKYMDFSEEGDADLMALWCLGTYFHQCFNIFPYIFVNAVKQSGKTKLLTLTSMMAFNARPGLAHTPSTLYRLIQNNRCTLLIDENENLLKRKDENDIRSLLLAGYKKGMSVPRTGERTEGDTKLFLVEDYDLYSPKMLANISGIEDVLEDRCITLVLQRTRNPEKGNRELDIMGKEWQGIRDKLYLCLMTEGVRGVRGVISTPQGEIEKKEMPMEHYYNYFFLNTLRDYSPNGAYSPLTNRELELWSPILLLAKAVSDDLFIKMHTYACKKSTEKVLDNLTDTWDTILAETLQQEVQKDDWYSIRELTSTFLQLRGEEAEDKEWRKLVSHNTKWVGRALKRFKIVIQKKKIHGNMQVYLHRKEVEDFAGRLGLPDYKPSAEETTQTTPKPESDGQLQLEEL